MRRFVAPVCVAPMLFAWLPALAQSPSADQIIQSLKPSGNLVQGNTRGIRLVAPNSDGQSPSPPQVTQHPAGTSQQSVVAPRPVLPPPASQSPSGQSASSASPAGPSVNLTVNFTTGSAELTPDAIRTLDALGKALSSQDLASYRFRIEGHTDTVGTAEYNQRLSQQRAEAVVAYISKKYSVDPSRLQAVGMGEQGLLVQTPAQISEPRNRRVQVINLGA
jgi:OOP family OmpA-OmpF porin